MCTPHPFVALHVDANKFDSKLFTIPAYPTIVFVDSVKMVTNPVAGRFNVDVNGWMFTRYATVCALIIDVVWETRVKKRGKKVLVWNIMVKDECSVN